MQGNPTSIPPHHLKNHHTLVAFGSRVQTVQRIHHAVDGGIESKGHRGGLKIVVDRFGHPDHLNPILQQLQSGGQ